MTEGARAQTMNQVEEALALATVRAIAGLEDTKERDTASRMWSQAAARENASYAGECVRDVIATMKIPASTGDLGTLVEKGLREWRTAMAKRIAPGRRARGVENALKQRTNPQARACVETHVLRIWQEHSEEQTPQEHGVTRVLEALHSAAHENKSKYWNELEGHARTSSTRVLKALRTATHENSATELYQLDVLAQAAKAPQEMWEGVAHTPRWLRKIVIASPTMWDEAPQRWALSATRETAHRNGVPNGWPKHEKALCARIEEGIKSWPYEGTIPPLIALVASLQSQGHAPRTETEWGACAEIEATLREPGKTVEQVGAQVTREQTLHNEARCRRDRWFGPWPKICKLAETVLVETGVCMQKEASQALREVATRWNSQEFLEFEYEGGREISLKANDEQLEWHISVRSPESVLAAVGIEHCLRQSTPEGLARAIEGTLATAGKVVIPVGPLAERSNRNQVRRRTSPGTSVRTRRRAAGTLAKSATTWAMLKQQPGWVINEVVKLGWKGTAITTGEPSRWAAKLVLANTGNKADEKVEEAISETLRSWPWLGNSPPARATARVATMATPQCTGAQWVAVMLCESSGETQGKGEGCQIDAAMNTPEAEIEKWIEEDALGRLRSMGHNAPAMVISTMNELWRRSGVISAKTRPTRGWFTLDAGMTSWAVPHNTAVRLLAATLGTTTRTELVSEIGRAVACEKASELAGLAKATNLRIAQAQWHQTDQGGPAHAPHWGGTLRKRKTDTVLAHHVSQILARALKQ